MEARKISVPISHEMRDVALHLTWLVSSGFHLQANIIYLCYLKNVISAFSLMVWNVTKIERKKIHKSLLVQFLLVL